MTTPARFTKSDLRRALEAAKEAGLNIQRFEIDLNGKIAVYSGPPAPAPKGRGNSWDDLRG